jgi:hypothetical protein
MAKQNKKDKKNIIWFIDPVYRQEYVIFFAPTYKKFCEIVKKEINFSPHQEEGDENVIGEFNGLTNKGGSLGVIWSSDKTVNLMHELFHACAWTLRNRDIYLTPDSEETYAYYYTFLYRSVMEFVRANRRKYHD